MNKVLIALTAALLPITSNAAGYALAELSTSGLGNAFSGMSARSHDASTQFYNPASMSYMIPGSQIVSGGSLIVPDVRLKDGQVRNSSFGGIPVQGNDGGDTGKDAVVPFFYFKTDINDQLTAGLGVNAPFGLSTDYNSGWEGRYVALHSELKIININPSLAWKVSDQFSVGAGVSVQYATAKLSNAIDSSAICRARASLATCNALGLATPGNASTDSKVKLEGDDISYGYNVGVLFKPNTQTTVGLSFRSSIEQELKGKAKFRRSAGLNTLLSNSQALTNSDISADLDLPESASLSTAFQVNDQLELLVDATWTNWSQFKELRIDFENPAQSDAVTTQKWQDTWRYSLGANYKLSPTLTLRTGIAYDETPVRNERLRTPRIPDQDRKWVSVGSSWKYDQQNTVEIGYAHLFIKDTKINNTSEGDIKYNIMGNYESSADLLSVQITHLF